MDCASRDSRLERRPDVLVPQINGGGQLLCCAVLCCVVLCCAVLCCALLRCAVLCSAVLWRCSAVLRYALLCCAVLCVRVGDPLRRYCGAAVVMPTVARRRTLQVVGNNLLFTVVRRLAPRLAPSSRPLPCALRISVGHIASAEVCGSQCAEAQSLSSLPLCAGGSRRSSVSRRFTPLHSVFLLRTGLLD
jgi:hypothetical protein